MEEDNKPSRRGGRREGAGRPKGDSQLYTFRAGGVLAKVLNSCDNRTDFIRGCIMKSLPEDGNPLCRFGEVYRADKVADLVLPVFDIRVPAGFPVPLDSDERSQDIHILEKLCPHPESCYLINVSGDSMIGADIYDGDIAIVDKSKRNPTEHEVAVCEYNGEYTLKRFRRDGDIGWLVPANPAYPEIRITPDDNFSVWGTVTYVIHKPK